MYQYLWQGNGSLEYSQKHARRCFHNRVWTPKNVKNIRGRDSRWTKMTKYSNPAKQTHTHTGLVLRIEAGSIWFQHGCSIWSPSWGRKSAKPPEFETVGMEAQYSRYNQGDQPRLPPSCWRRSKRLSAPLCVVEGFTHTHTPQPGADLPESSMQDHTCRENQYSNTRNFICVKKSAMISYAKDIW